MLPPAAHLDNPADSIPARHLHNSLNKIKHPINVVLWTPEGRRLLTGSSSGEFTLWNGMGFNFETIMQAHDTAVRAAKYSHSDDWLVSGDQDGMIKYWQPNFNNVKALQAHSEPIRDIAFAPSDSKFLTAADDATIKIYDFAGGIEESELKGHGWEVRTADWHPTKGLLVSGSKDHQVKLWDPRNGRCLTTLYGHKSMLSKTRFAPQGDLLATCARDNTARVFDLRMMRDVLLLKGHDKDVTCLVWHPIHRNLLSTSTNDGSIHHFLLDEQNSPPGIATTISPYDSTDPANAPAQTIYPAHSIPFAHEMAIWTMDWHPLGHILASGSNDRVTRFWARPRPGEVLYLNDRYHIGQTAAEAQGTYDRRDARRQQKADEAQEAEDEAYGLQDQVMPPKSLPLVGLPGLLPADGASAQLPGLGTAPPLPLPSMPQGFDPSKVPDFSKLADMFGGQLPIPPVPPPGAAGAQFPPLPPGFPPIPPPGGVPLPPGFTLPAGFPPPPAPGAVPVPVPTPMPGVSVPLPGAIPGTLPGALPGTLPGPLPGALPGISSTTPPANGAAIDKNASIRRRAPLPSQAESLQEEMRKGKFQRVR